MKHKVWSKRFFLPGLNIKIGLALLAIILVTGISSHAQEPVYTIQAKTSCYDMFFTVNLFDVNSRIRSNSAAAKALDNYISDYIWHNQVDSVSVAVSIVAYTSIDGNWKYNEDLSQKRLNGIKEYLFHNYPVLQHCAISVLSMGEDWEGFKNQVEADSLIPFRDELTCIIDSTQLEWDQKEIAIKQLGKGKTYAYLQKTFYLLSEKHLYAWYLPPYQNRLQYSQPNYLQEK